MENVGSEGGKQVVMVQGLEGILRFMENTLQDWERTGNDNGTFEVKTQFGTDKIYGLDSLRNAIKACKQQLDK
jgi:hypothetical protein